MSPPDASSRPRRALWRWFRRRSRALERASFACVDRVLGDLVPLLETGLLDAADAARVEAHLAACHACAADQRALAALHRSLGALTAEEAEVASLEPALDRGRTGRARLVPSSGAMLAIAGVVALALLVGWQRARDHAFLSEVVALRERVARVERRDGSAETAAALARHPAHDNRPIVPIVGARFAGPPNY